MRLESRLRCISAEQQWQSQLLMQHVMQQQVLAGKPEPAPRSWLLRASSRHQQRQYQQYQQEEQQEQEHTNNSSLLGKQPIKRRCREANTSGNRDAAAGAPLSAAHTLLTAPKLVQGSTQLRHRSCPASGTPSQHSSAVGACPRQKHAQLEPFHQHRAAAGPLPTSPSTAAVLKVVASAAAQADAATSALTKAAAAAASGSRGQSNRACN